MDCPAYGTEVSKKWWKDKYCDDAYNTPGCFYDGGDCCRQVGGWNNFCSDCTCSDVLGANRWGAH